MTFLGGCRGLVARFWDKAHINAFVEPCPDFVLAVGDSIQFRATFMIQNAQSGMAGPYHNVMLYTSEERPKSFEWSLSYPPPSTGTTKYYPIGAAEITRTGVLIAKDTGVVYVHAKGAGKQASRVEMWIVPKVERFTLFPHDTSVQVGDTIFLNSDAALAKEFRQRNTFAWNIGLNNPEDRLLTRVERDPDVKPDYDPRKFPVVAVRAGTAKVAACFAGARRDTTTIRITGEPQVVNRNVAPRLRLTPADTTVYVGEDFSANLRILNANLGNGPYKWFTTTGDDSVYYDSANTGAITSAYGFDRLAFVRHVYFKPGRYPWSVTVSDAAGRGTTLRGTYTALIREFETRVVLPDGKRFVRLSAADEPDIAIALLQRKAKRLYPSHISGAFVLTRMSGVPPLLFGRTAFDPERDGRRRVQRDVNGDGELDDVFYVDKATLIRNGDLRPGRNRLVITGSAGRVDRQGRDSTTTFWVPIRAVVEFEAIP